MITVNLRKFALKIQFSHRLRVRTHDQNFVPLIICNKIVTLPKINVPSRQINVPSCQINDPPSQINVPHCQINVPLSNKHSKFLRQNHDPRYIYLQEGHIFVSLFDHVYGPLVLDKQQCYFKITSRNGHFSATILFCRGKPNRPRAFHPFDFDIPRLKLLIINE